MEVPEISDTARAKVRLAFNPSGLTEVEELKTTAAYLITLIEQAMVNHPLAAREGAIAITHIQTASMFAVFTATSP